MKYVKKIGAWVKDVKARILLVMLFLVARPAFAKKISDFSNTWKSEWGQIVPVVLMVIAGVGIIFGSVSVISAIMAKKNQRPLEWQVWGMVGGGLATVIPTIILAVSGSLTGEDGSAESALSELNLKY